MILLPAANAEEWKRFLREPERHWQTGYSAKALAYCWQEAGGFPASVRTALRESGDPFLQNLKPLLVLPEHQVPLPGGANSPSQNDVWVLASSGDVLASVAVEGKVSEAFGKESLGQWRQDWTPGRQERYAFLIKTLALPADLPAELRYQLLHRTASAVIEARRFCARHAIMLVHSFSQTDERFDDYELFVSQFRSTAARGAITPVGERDGIILYLGWVRGEPRYLEV